MKLEKHQIGILVENDEQPHKNLDDLLEDCFFDSNDFGSFTATKIYSRKLNKQRFVFTHNTGEIQRTGWMSKEESYNFLKKMLNLAEP